jgi:hypothetical protein
MLAVVFAGVVACASPRPGEPAAERGDASLPADGGSDAATAGRDASVVDLPPRGDGSGGSGGSGGGISGGAAGAGCVPGTEVCDGMDNDCDGQRDENLTEDCGTACGAGTRRCVNGQWDSLDCPRAPAADDVMACGAPGGSMCQRCRTDTDGTAACRGGVCSLDCNIGFIRCNGTPSFCVRPIWSFENGSEGFSSEVGPQSANDGIDVSSTRAAEGSRSFSVAASFGDNNCERRNVNVNFRHCGFGGGSSDLAGKTLSLQVYLDGPALPPGAFELRVGGYDGSFTATPPVTGAWFTARHRFTGTDTGITGIYFNLSMLPPPASTCQTWRGTIYVDDVRIQ